MKKESRNSWGITLAMAVIALLSYSQVTLASGTTYYFSTSGNDGNSGLNQSTPKQSLPAAASLMNEGNTILFKRGDKWYSPSFEWSFSDKTGTLSNPILIDAYGSGPKPIIACMELMTSGWINMGSNRWSHPLGGYTDASRCFINGVSTRKVSTPDSVDDIHKYAVGFQTIYIYSSSVPTMVEVINNATTFGCLEMTNCSYITFRNLEFRGSGNWFAIEVEEQSSHVTFDSCNVIELFMYGIIFHNSGKNYSLYHESPVIKNCYLNMGWTSEERTNQSWGGDGINFRNAVRNGLIQSNTVVDFQHCGITLELESSLDYEGVNNNIVERNEVYLTTLGYCHGFDVQGIEGKATGNIFRRNYFHDLTNSGHLLGNGNYMYSNIFKNITMGTVGSTVQPYAVDIVPFKWKNMQFISKNNVFVNNTIYDTDASAIRITGPTLVYENIFKNNIVLKWALPDTIWSNYGFRNDGSFQPQIVENNCIYNYGQTGGKVIRQGDKSDVYTAKEANDVFSNYNNNIDVNPLLIDPENGDFHLQPDSPCRAAGQALSGMDSGFVDYYGKVWANQPSIGAIQYTNPDEITDVNEVTNVRIDSKPTEYIN
jgi:hypothetical protein